MVKDKENDNKKNDKIIEIKLDKSNKDDKDDEKIKEELSKLPPAQRIQRLREIEEKAKREIEKIQSALEESIKLAKEEEMRRELEEIEQEKERKKITIVSEKESLEQRVKKAPELTEEQRQMIRYGNPLELLEQKNPYILAQTDFYNRLANIREEAKTGYISRENMEFIYSFQESLNEASQRYVANPQVREMLTRSEAALRQIQMYKEGKLQEQKEQKKKSKPPEGY